MPRATPVEERFWPKVQKTETCWLWTGAKAGRGYGMIGLNRRHVGAHRVSWTLHYGPIPDGLWVLHRCDNPPCVRPDHLFLGTRRDNAHDMIAKNRHGWAGITHCPKGHPYDEANTLISDGRRYCRTCLRAKYRAWATPEREAARKRKQRAKNPKVQRQADRRYYAKNRDRLVAEARERRARLRAEKESR